MADRWTRLAELAVHGANVQPDQILMVSAELGQEELARAVAAAGYARGARFVDVVYFDPHLKHARVRYADPTTLDYVPDWYGERLLTLAEGRGARIALSGPIEPNLMDDLDATLVGRDRLPWLKETSKVIADRSTNWSIVPCPNPTWAALVHPDLPADEASDKLWAELEHVLRLDEADPVAAWDERMAVLNTSAARLADRHFDAIEFRGPGTELTIGLLPTHTFSDCPPLDLICIPGGYRGVIQAMADRDLIAFVQRQHVRQPHAALSSLSNKALQRALRRSH